ncbi:MAG TPA: ABC transporter ATP-binding protein, partial [Thermoguttaceae bacterium]|nr:ABC transporter ATP-binding protein [Thermoguttaceae bacterium]
RFQGRIHAAMNNPRMTNFGRVIRLALRYRTTFALSLVTALCVGLLWGANIGTVYPFFKVAFKGQSLHKWVNDETDASIKIIRQKTDEILALRAKLDQTPPDQRSKIDGQLVDLRRRVQAEWNLVWRYDLVRPFIERCMPRSPMRTVVLLVVVLLAGTVVKDIFIIANSILVARISQLAEFDLRKLFYRRTLRMDLGTFNDEGTSDLLSRFTYDMDSVAAGLMTLFGKLIREPLKGITCLVLAAVICWRLLLLTLVVAPLAAWAINWLAKMLKRANRRAMEEMAQLYNRLEETFRAIQVVKAFTTERYERWRFHLSSKQYNRRAMKIARYDALSHPITETLGVLTICLAILAGAYLVIYRQTHLLGIRMSNTPLDLEMILTFFAALAGTADPMRKLSEVFSRLQRAAAASDRIYAMLDREPTIRDPKRPKPLPRHNRDLVFDHVHFAYSSGEPVLQDVSLSIRAGETIALVGPNGCGKSTLANLIPRFADPTSGEVRMDGVSLRDARLRDIRSQIGLVSQETMLFDDTVMQNIRYGSPKATDADVIRAAQAAHAHGFIENRLADGYQTIVGAGGTRLSGGQRQRIALARAILRDPAILILDEATSQVDLESERLIQQVLETFIRNRTAVIITHRLAVLTLADRIVVMEAGRILDVGTHDELMHRCELYGRLHKAEPADLRRSA